MNPNTHLLEHNLATNTAKQWHQCLFIVIVMKFSHKCLIMTSRTVGFAMNSCQWNSQHMNTYRT